MGALSSYVCDKVVDLVLNGTAWTPPAAVYLALSLADPTADGSGLSEPVAATYVRKAITFTAASSHRVTQSAIVQFDQALDAAWGAITHYALYDAETGGNMLAFGSLSATANVDQYKSLAIPAGEVYVEFGGDISDYLANAMLNHTFNATSYSVPTTCIAIVHTEILVTDGGADLGECSMTNYARVAYSSWDAISGGATQNSAEIDWGVLIGVQDTLTGVAIMDSTTIGAGNVLFFDNDPDITIDIGDRVRIAIGDYDLSVV